MDEVSTMKMVSVSIANLCLGIVLACVGVCWRVWEPGS